MNSGINTERLSRYIDTAWERGNEAITRQPIQLAQEDSRTAETASRRCNASGIWRAAARMRAIYSFCSDLIVKSTALVTVPRIRNT